MQGGSRPNAANRKCSPLTNTHAPNKHTQIVHANVIDTSVLFPHPRGPPFKSALRVLASRHLLRTIQQGARPVGARDLSVA